jgi:hypothetical protein
MKHTVGAGPFLVSRVGRGPCARCHRVEGTLLESDRAAYVLGLEGSRPSESAALARSILLYNGDGNEGRWVPKRSTQQAPRMAPMCMDTSRILPRIEVSTDKNNRLEREVQHRAIES